MVSLRHRAGPPQRRRSGQWPLSGAGGRSRVLTQMKGAVMSLLPRCLGCVTHTAKPMLSVARTVYGHRASLCPFSVLLVEKAAESSLWGSDPLFSMAQCKVLTVLWTNALGPESPRCFGPWGPHALRNSGRHRGRALGARSLYSVSE